MTPPAPSPDGLTILAPPRTLCHCLQVSEEEVVRSIELQGCRSVAEVTATCGAGGGCTCCHGKIREQLRRVGR